MTVTVSFCTPAISSRSPGVGIATVRAMEEVAVGGVSTITALAGEFIIVGNHETTMKRIAAGSAPDADLTASTAASTAGFPVPAGLNSDPIIANLGDKVSVVEAD